MKQLNKIETPMYAVEDCVDCQKVNQSLIIAGEKGLDFDEGLMRTSFLCPHPLVCYFHEQHRIINDAKHRIDTGGDDYEQNKIIKRTKRGIAEHLFTGFVPDDWDDPYDNLHQAITDFEEICFED